jgi:hypothetical protein
VKSADQTFYSALFVEPDVFKSPVVINAVLVLHVAFDVRMPRGVGNVVGDNGVGDILGQLSLDRPHKLLALCDLCLL